jgi:hypothetical protein
MPIKRARSSEEGISLSQDMPIYYLSFVFWWQRMQLWLSLHIVLVVWSFWNWCYDVSLVWHSLFTSTMLACMRLGCLGLYKSFVLSTSKKHLCLGLLSYHLHYLFMDAVVSTAMRINWQVLMCDEMLRCLCLGVVVPAVWIVITELILFHSRSDSLWSCSRGIGFASSLPCVLRNHYSRHIVPHITYQISVNGYNQHT